MTIVLFALLLVCGVIGWFILAYNSLVGGKNTIDNCWSQIDVQLKRRHDLIPNLVETAKGYMAHERDTLENVTKARAAAVQADSMSDKTLAESVLGSALGRLMAVAESYPELKANQNFLALHEELTSTENRIAFARQAYNDAVLFFNNRLLMFPSNIVAGMYNFSTRPYFELEDKIEREAPKVSFSNN